MVSRAVRRPALTALILAATLVGPSSSGRLRAQESALRAERTIDFAVGKALPIDVKVGQVHVQTVEFTDRGRVAPGAMKQTVGETSTVLRAHFLAENATADEWQVTFTVEFLDKSGKVIDRATKKSSWEGEAKPTDLDHPLLQYVVPLIDKVRIRMDAKLD